MIYIIDCLNIKIKSNLIINNYIIFIRDNYLLNLIYIL